MLEKCESCGTVFEVDESLLSKKIKWLKCGVCNEKWIISSNLEKSLNELEQDSNDAILPVEIDSKHKSEKVKQELASIKSVVEDKSKNLSKSNPVLNQKNKSVAEIASELSMSKSTETNKNQYKKIEKKTTTKLSKKLNILPFFLIAVSFIFFLVLFFRSTIIGYSFLYFPTYSQKFIEKVDAFFTKIYLPILVQTNNLNLIDFAATVQEKEIRFTGTIRNTSKTPILVPRIGVLGIREDRKIILEKNLILEDKIIPPKSEINFKKIVGIDIPYKKDNVTIKATLLKKYFYVN